MFALIIKVLVAELANKKNRFLTIYSYTSFVIAIFIYHYLSNKFYLWRNLQLVIASSIFTVIFGCWYMPNSPRWLLCKYRKEEAFYLLMTLSGTQHIHPHSYVIETKRLETTKIRIFFEMVKYLLRKRIRIFLIFCVLFSISTLFFSCSSNANILNYFKFFKN